MLLLLLHLTSRLSSLSCDGWKHSAVKCFEMTFFSSSHFFFIQTKSVNGKSKYGITCTQSSDTLLNSETCSIRISIQYTLQLQYSNCHHINQANRVHWIFTLKCCHGPSKRVHRTTTTPMDDMY